MATTSATDDTTIVDELAGLYARARSRAARDRLIEATLGLADAAAWRYAGRGEPFDDLRQVARLGLVRAAERYRPTRGAFAAFAAATIRGELRRHFRDTTWSVQVPRRTQEMVTKVRSCAERLEHALGRSASPTEIARELGVGLDAVLESYAAAAAHRVEPVDEADERPSSSRAEAEADERIDVRRALATMTPRDRRLLALRFDDELSQSAIAHELGVSQVHVSRLLARATDRMREAMGTC